MDGRNKNGGAFNPAVFRHSVRRVRIAGHGRNSAAEICGQDRQSCIGSIIVADQRWEFYDTTHALICAMKLETVVESEGNLETWLGAIVSGNGHFPGTTIFKYWLLQDGSGTTLGKYYIDLKNIDLTQDAGNRFDLRIAAFFAILADNSTVKNSA